MVERLARHYLEICARRYPVVAATGPRQSGKTTLCRQVFPTHAYVSMEAPDIRRAAMDDPRRFLEGHGDGAVIDEIQRTPELLSYLQTEVDLDPRPGRFIITGSENLVLSGRISQSLAGRVALVTLLPCTLAEVRAFDQPAMDLWSTVRHGGYPAIFDKKIPAEDWLANYFSMYVERDVRQVLNVTNLLPFETFVKIAAGRTSQLVNFSALGADCGVTHNTAIAWTSVLEASFVLFRLPPFHANTTSRLIKTPKIHFYDTGLAAHLLGVRTDEHLFTHPLRGPLFETWVVTEIMKSYFNRGRRPAATFYRDKRGTEIDLVIDDGPVRLLIETKSGATYESSFAAAFDRADLGPDSGRTKKIVVYGGDRSFRSGDVDVIAWHDLASLQEA
jgi:predicted AAA+ superfamily ATPase